MSERDDNVIRTVVWSEVFPWLSIVRSFRLAIAARVLVLGAAGILLTATVWAMIGGIFGADSPGTQWLSHVSGVPVEKNHRSRAEPAGLVGRPQ